MDDDAQIWANLCGQSEGVICSSCGAPYDHLDSGWRWRGDSWEHKCKSVDAQSGHFAAIRKEVENGNTGA
jgi:hypothetical protein